MRYTSKIIIRIMLLFSLTVSAVHAQPLHDAAARGDFTKMRELLSGNTNVNARDRQGKGLTALIIATYYGHIAIVNLLLGHGAEVNARDQQGRTALMFAADGGHTEIVKLLLMHGAEVNSSRANGETALMVAAYGGHAEIVELLLARGVEVNTKDQQGGTVLMIAADGGHTEIVKLLLAQGAEVNSRTDIGQTALMGAAYGGHAEIVKLLLAHGADVNAKGQQGWTALMRAADSGHTEIVKLLLAHGAEVNSRGEDGQTSLILAVNGGYIKIMKMLLEHGADVNVKNNDGDTALIRAFKRGDASTVKFLLEHGAEICMNALLQFKNKKYPIRLVRSLALGSNGYEVFLGDDSAPKILNAATARIVKIFKDHEISFPFVVFRLDGQEMVKTLTEHTDDMTAVTLSPDRRYILSGDRDKRLNLWRASNKNRPFSVLRLWEKFSKEPGPITTFEGLQDPAASLVFRPDGQGVLSAGFDGTLHLWSMPLKPPHPFLKFWKRHSLEQPVRTFTSPVERISCLAFTPDGQFAIAGTYKENSLTLWEVESGEVIRTFRGHDDTVTSVALSPNGKYAISGSHDGALRLWNLATGQEIAIMLPFTEYDDEWLTITPEGYYAASDPFMVTMAAEIGLPADFHRPDIVKLAIKLGDSQQAVEQALQGTQAEDGDSTESEEE